MEAVHTQANVFSADDLRILESAANWTAVAIGNARQHAELAQRLQESRALTAISQALNETLDLDRVLRLIATSARQIIPQAEHTVIHLLDENACQNCMHEEQKALHLPFQIPVPV